MKIKGKVFQIIKYNKKENYMLPRYLFNNELANYDVIQDATNDKMNIKENK